MSLLETALVIAFILPTLFVAVGFIDYAYCMLSLRNLATESLGNFSEKTLKLTTGDQGFYTYSRTNEVSTFTQNISFELQGKLTSAFQLYHSEDVNRYSVQSAFVFYAVNEMSGEVTAVSNWGDSSSPTGDSHYRAFRKFQNGNLNPPDYNNLSTLFCNPEFPVPPASLTTTMPCSPSQEADLTGPEGKYLAFAIPSKSKGAFLQANYGPSNAYNGATISNYLRHSVKIGITLTVSIANRPAAGVVAKFGLPATLSVTKIISPRSHF